MLHCNATSFLMNNDSLCAVSCGKDELHLPSRDYGSEFGHDYCAARQRGLESKFESLHAEYGLIGKPLTLVAFHKCNKEVELCFSEDFQCLKCENLLVDLFNMYWKLLGNELQVILGSLSTSPDIDEYSNGALSVEKCSSRRYMSSSEGLSMGNNKDLEYYHVKNEQLQSDIQVVISMAKECWNLEGKILGHLHHIWHGLTIINDKVKARPHCDCMFDRNLKEKSSWRSLFVPYLADIMNAVRIDMLSAADLEIEQEWEAVQTQEKLKTINTYVCQSIAAILSLENDGMIQVLHSISSLCQSGRSYLPLAMMADFQMSALRLCFVESSLKVCSRLLIHVTAMSRVVPARLDPSTLYILLSSLFELKTNLHMFTTVSNNCQSHHVCHDVTDMETAVVEQIIKYHCDVLNTHILHNADSHDWTNNKPWFENERSSFSVQQWYLHLQALRHDLWKSYSIHQASYIFAQVLGNSLRLFVSRYSIVRPTEARTCQLRADIIAILACVDSFMEFVCGCISNYPEVDCLLSCSKSNRIVETIYNLCGTLVLIMVIITVPLKMVYKAFKKGIQQNSVVSSYSSCLVKISRIFLPSSALIRESSGDPVSTSVLIRHLKLFCNHPQNNWIPMFNFLLGASWTACKLLISHPYISTIKAPEFKNEKLADGFSSVECLSSLMYSLHHSASFADIYLWWMKQCGLRPDFFFKYYEKETNSLAVICTKIVVDVLEPFIESIFASVTIFLASIFYTNDEMAPRRFSEHDIIMEKPVVGSQQTVADITVHILEILSDNVALIPESVLQLLMKLDEQKDYNDTPGQRCSYLPFQILCLAISVSFRDRGQLYFGDRLMKNSTVLSIVSDLSENFLLISKGAALDNHLANGVLGFEILASSFTSTVFNVRQHVLSTSNLVSNEYSFQPSSGKTALLDLIYSSNKAKALSSLRCLRWFLLSHKQWFLHNLTMIPDPDEGFASIVSVQTDVFNSFDHSIKIGETGYTFKQDSLLRTTIDWMYLIEEISKCIQRNVFCSLLTHRWEFQLEALLDEPQHRYVAILRDIYIT